MARIYKVRINSLSGAERYVSMPSFDYAEERFSGSFYSIEDATRENPVVFDHTYTFFAVNDDSYEILVGLGFTDVVKNSLYSEHYEYWYFSENRRFLIDQYGVSYQVLENEEWETIGAAGTFGAERTIFSLYSYFPGITQTTELDGRTDRNTITNLPYFILSTISGIALMTTRELQIFFEGLSPVDPTPTRTKSIPVNWPRYNDGKILTASFDITVSPKSNTSGGTTGGTTVDDDGFSGNEGTF